LVSEASVALNWQQTHSVPVNLVQLLDEFLAVLLCSKEIVQMSPPLLRGDGIPRELLDVSLNVWTEDGETAKLAFEPEKEVGALKRGAATSGPSTENTQRGKY
jgi:hypothetical protein